MTGTVTVVLVHWNQCAALIETADAFSRQPECGRIIVVDNGSTAEQLRAVSQLRDVELVALGDNTGFGPAANRGIELWLDTDSTDWCVVAPHDALPAERTLAKLLAAATTQAQVGLLSADVGDGLIPIVDHVFGPITRPSQLVDGFEASDYPHGTLLIASRFCLDEIGLFDERYFAYCEEADLGLRAKAAGWEVGVVRGARVYNTHVDTAAPVVDYLMERNTLLLLADHFGRRKAALRGLIGLVQLVNGLVRPAKRGDFWSPRARLRAYFDAGSGRWGPPPANLNRRSATDLRPRPRRAADV